MTTPGEARAAVAGLGPGPISRRDVIRAGAALGILLPALGCGGRGDQEPVTVDRPPRTRDVDDRSVIVVGAGAAGLTAAQLLKRAGVNVRVFEAGDTYGGRMRRAPDMVDIALPLGAEWLHDEPAALSQIAGRPVHVPLVGYGPADRIGFYDGELTVEPVDDDDLTFVGSSWLDFYEEHVVGDVIERLELRRQIVRIDDTGGRVIVTDARGGTADADAVIVTVPVAVLRRREITFVPDLADHKWTAIDAVPIWGGLKAFVEFDERFYPTFVAFSADSHVDGQRLYYDATHGQDTTSHVLGLFAVGAPATAYQGLDPDALRSRMLNELDQIFDGAASPRYRRHVSLDWSAQPFIGQAYVADHADPSLVSKLGEPASERVVFAGDAYTDGEDWSAVHVAAASARRAVERVLRSF